MIIHSSTSAEQNLCILRELLQDSEPLIDLGHAKLIIDRMIDPTIDITATIKQLDSMVSEITARWQLANASSLDKLNALRTYLYHPGEWNANRPFVYSWDDPYGKDLRHKLLPDYLSSRKGNCVSMPSLFLILGRKLGLDLSFALAPQHIFLKYRDNMGNFFSLEPTDKATPTQDTVYHRQLTMTSESLANGLYLRPLGNRETEITMMTTLMEFYRQQEGMGEHRIAVAGLALEFDSRNVNAMLHIGEAFHLEIKRLFLDKYFAPKDNPLEQRPYYEYLSRNNQAWFAKAEALGWREPTKAIEESYFERVERKKIVAL